MKQKSILHKLYQDNLFRCISAHTGLPKNFYKNKILLDVGCGNGIDSNRFSKHAKKVIGLDIERSPEWTKNKSKKIIFKKGDAENLPFENNYFDIVFAKDMLHHTPNPNKALKEMKRVLKKHGVILIVEGNRYNPLSYIHMTKLNGHEHFPQKTFVKMIDNNFPNSQFSSFESHFFPFLGEKAMRLIFRIEDILAEQHIFKPYLSYNTALYIDTNHPKQIRT